MRLKNKYKTYLQSNQLPEIFHTRLLNFKRPKWKKLQKSIISQNESRKLLVNNFSIKNNFKAWDKVRSYFKQGLKVKNSIHCHFDSSLGIRHIKKVLQNKSSTSIRNLLVQSIIKPEFRLDILLWRLNFFNSSYQARHFINNGDVYVNENRVLGNIFLKKGDIITFSDTLKLDRINIENNLKLLSIPKSVATFLEVDYYTNTIILTKNFFELHMDDINLLTSEMYDLKKIKDFY